MEIIMPKMGESVNEGTIIKWHKKKGDAVKRDEIIFEISTDKVDTEIPSPADGVLTDIFVNEGDTVEVGTAVAVLNASGEAASATPVKTEKPEIKEEATPVVETPVENKMVETQQTQPSASSGLIEIAMPKMGESVMEGTIIKWHKKVGDKIKKDETVFEISTDKVDTEVPSPEDGLLAEILVGEQETVEVGTIVAKLSTTGAIPQKPVSVKTEEKKVETKAEPVSMHDNFSNVSISEEGKIQSDRFYSPLVLSIANKEKVSLQELERIPGSGLEGRVTKKDILGYVSNRGTQKVETVKKKEPVTAAPAPSFTMPQSQTVYSSADVEKIPMDNIRQKIMQHMVASRDTSVHVSAMLEVDMSRIYKFIQAKKDEYQKNEGVKLTYMPFIAHAVVRALKEYSLINSTIDGSTILKKKYINLGIAVAIEPTGLIVPNIKGAGEKNIIGLAKSINDLAFRARNKKLTPDDISNGTFTITNYGVFGTIFGTPIINQPEVAILGVGTVVKKPVVVEVDGNDTIAIKPVMALTLSHDHRLVDGMLGGLFLKHLKESLENFDSTNV
ncbi:MAG: 2-oxoglutarate dehydrogenase, E2 component, dihydrolipoamide succinyltransferase [Ignavibacteriales bacterium]|nr:MAG: 2-oxoglutarate dehydrogenase, E2 component, dihydrolipoamide succinyltransferase [Ignavibacteriales bacterium]